MMITVESIFRRAIAARRPGARVVNVGDRIVVVLVQISGVRARIHGLPLRRAGSLAIRGQDGQPLVLTQDDLQVGVFPATDGWLLRAGGREYLLVGGSLVGLDVRVYRWFAERLGRSRQEKRKEQDRVEQERVEQDPDDRGDESDAAPMGELRFFRPTRGET